MAIDNTPPRLKLIITIAVITIVSLVSLDFILKSYYAYMSDDAIRSKLAPPIELDEQNAAVSKSLSQAKIDQAMAQLSKGTRADSITPQASDDITPLTGWSKMPKVVPPTPAPHATNAVAPIVEGDGGVRAEAGAADAGPPKMGTVTDGGAKH
jgi:hypothetical protein